MDSAIYGHNQANQRTAFTNAAGTYVLYSYDNIGQLVVATSSVSSEKRGYFYDTAWNLNRRTNNGVAATFSVDAKNELTADPGSSSDSYDSNVKVGGMKRTLSLPNRDQDLAPSASSANLAAGLLKISNVWRPHAGFQAYLKAFIATAPCDLRASFNGLWNAAQTQVGKDPGAVRFQVYWIFPHLTTHVIFCSVASAWFEHYLPGT